MIVLDNRVNKRAEMHSIRQPMAKMGTIPEKLLKYHERARDLAQIIVSD
jgi:hypothetical protein